MKVNFNIKKKHNTIKNQKNKKIESESAQDVTQKEFEEFILKSGAKGSFMVYRTSKKENELGLEEL